jgi:hypothetical protein
MSAGKGDKPRKVNKKQFDNNFDNIIINKDINILSYKDFIDKYIYKTSSRGPLILYIHLSILPSTLSSFGIIIISH